MGLTSAQATRIYCGHNDLKADCEGSCMFRCISCGLHHESVEAGGIYWCPTPGCTVSGAAWWRTKLKSYKVVENGRHTVDPLEAITFAAEYEVTDPAIAEARKRACKKWLDYIDTESMDMTECLPALAAVGLVEALG